MTTKGTATGTLIDLGPESSPSSTTSSSLKNIHLLVLIHGMWGSSDHLQELANSIREVHSKPQGSISTAAGPDIELDVLVAQSNQSAQTYDGIDWGAERVIKEIRERIQDLQSRGCKVTKFSITGYSLGGLVARYVVGALYHAEFFKDVDPVNFNTMATPHLGIPRYPTYLSSTFAALGPRLLSRTGEQFFAVDKWDGPEGRPLLDIMSRQDSIFYKGLSLFPHIVVYANSINDATVPYLTAAIETEDPFLNRHVNGLRVKLDEKYSPLMQSYGLPDAPPPLPPAPPFLSPAYFISLQKKIFIPPALQVRWPFNIVVVILLPLLIPLLCIVIIVRLFLASRASRERIRLLEADTSRSNYLRSLFRGLEEDVDAAEISADVQRSMFSPVSSLTATTSSGGIRYSTETQATSNTKNTILRPRLTPLQVRIAKNLNSIPHLKKKLAYIDGVVNSHPVIVSRDVKRFDFHKKGRGVVQNWADSFVL